MENDRYLVRPGQDVLVVRNSIVERYNFPADYIFTVKFFPGALEAIFDVDQSRMINQVVDLREILPASLIQTVREMSGFENRTQLLQDFFLCQLKKEKKAVIIISGL